MSTSLHHAGGRHVLRFERRLSHPVAKVWRALTEPGELRHWFPALVEVDLRAGGPMSFSFEGVDAPADPGQVLEVDPPRVFAFTWQTEVLRFELAPDPEGCLLVFTHTFDDLPGAASFASGWTSCLGGLEARLEGRTHDWPQGLGDLHEQYVVEFGLDRGRLEHSGDGLEVRFERQLVSPPEVVWELLTGTAEDGSIEVGAPPPVGFTIDHARPGTVTAVRPPSLLEYAWTTGDLSDRPPGRVRWELSPGPGGARLVLRQSLPRAYAERRHTALAAWHVQLELLADRLVDGGRCRPEGRTEELRKVYAAEIP
jgi:uncharacterized protein YndB with AHSA1/START domain